MFKKVRTHRGQALAEYMALVPVAIAIMILAGMLTTEIISAFEQTEEIFEPVEYVCQEEDPISEPDGPLVANLGDHTVELISSVYDEGTNQTVVTYRVTNGGDPSISHWTLGMPLEIQEKVLSISEGNNEWGTDPTTGVTGLKFDTGYESSGGGGNDKDANKNEEENVDNGGNDNNGNNGNNKNEEENVDDSEANTGNGNSNNGNGKGNKNKSRFSTPTFTITVSTSASDHYRDIKIAFAGVAEWESRHVTIKAGQEVYHSVISAPVRTVELSADDPLCQ